MKILLTVAFFLIIIAGVVLVFFVSWFWRIFIIPITILLAVDIASNILRRKKG